MKRQLLVWFGFMATTLILPIVILISGIWYMRVLGQELKLRDFESDASELLESMRYVSDIEKYLCKNISEIFDLNASSNQLAVALPRFLREHALAAKYLVWSEDGEIFASNFDTRQLASDAKQTFLIMRDVVSNPDQAKKMSETTLASLRLFFGPDFFPRYYHMCFSGRFLSLLRTDVSKKRPLVWANFARDYGLCVFFDHEVIEGDSGLHHFVKQKKHDLPLGYLDAGHIVSNVDGLAEKLQPFFAGLKGNYSRIHEYAGYLIVTNFISSSRIGFCAIKTETVANSSFSTFFKSILVVMMLVILLFSVFSYRLIVDQKNVTISLTRQLLILFVVSNLLPGFVLLVIGSDYLQQLRRSLINSSFDSSSSYLQNIDELYISEYTVQKERMQKALPALVGALKKNRINKKSIKNFLRKQNPQPYRFFLVASDSGIVANHRGILKHGKVKTAFTKAFRDDKVLINTSDAIRKIGVFALNTLNQKPVDKKIGAEVEFIVETLTQKTPLELTQKFIDIDLFWQWALGHRTYPTYTQMLKIFDSELYDYLLLYLWDAYQMECVFMDRLYQNLNRNEFGLKILAVDERFARAYPAEALQNKRIRDFLLKMRDRTITKPEFCDINGENYLLTGHKCIYMQNMRLLALYPVARIDAQVGEKRSLLLMFVLVSLLISVSLGLFVSGSITGPLATLQIGVEAMSQRDFAHRLPDLGGDEFGHLARIFNETLVDLEEMHVARIVQEKIMTRMEKPLAVGNLQIYGQTISLSGMGGDYFELFTAADEKPAVLLGDVAGSGVATSLILAFVKSAVMQLHKYSADSSLFLTRLNRLMIKSARARQKKAFSCQYLHVVNDSQIDIASAGLPYPLLVDHLKLTAKPVELPAQPLGITASQHLTKLCLSLPPKNSLVCFTGGFIGHGSFAYDKMLDLIRNSTDDDPKQFCQNCFNKYFELVARNECRDDISLLIIHHPEVSEHGKQDN